MPIYTDVLFLVMMIIWSLLFLFSIFCVIKKRKEIVSFVKEKFGENVRIALQGESMGAATVLNSLKSFKPYFAAVDCPFSDTLMLLFVIQLSVGAMFLLLVAQMLVVGNLTVMLR